jgi:hypothetical protein
MADIISFETEKVKRLEGIAELVQSVGSVRNVLGDEKRAFNEAMRDEALSHLPTRSLSPCGSETALAANRPRVGGLPRAVQQVVSCAAHRRQGHRTAHLGHAPPVAAHGRAQNGLR